MGERAGSASSNLVGMPQGELYRGGRIGRYEILTQLSVGGMAELFLAFTNGPGGFRKFVVIKRILPDVKANENSVKMFFDEARITAALNHPNIAQVFDLGDSDGPYLAMEFIAGQNLNQITATCLKRKRPMPLGFSVGVTRDVCLALHHAHTFVDQSGSPFPVIHRDVAQKNVMVTYDGVTKLFDFGIAKSRGSLGRTNAGMVKGTTGYMSPEQVRGEPLDGRSDLFSAGVMLHELLTGHRLFAADTEAEEMERILAAPIPRPSALEPSIPENVADVVMHALARNRNERFPNARAMARALEKAAGSLLFGQDELAGFMGELFQAKRAATRALLESAGSEEQSLLTRTAVSTLTEDAGMTFPERMGTRSLESVPTDPVAPRLLPPPTPGRRQAGKGLPAGSPAKRRPRGWRIGLGLALGIGVVLLALWQWLAPG